MLRQSCPSSMRWNLDVMCLDVGPRRCRLSCPQTAVHDIVHSVLSKCAVLFLIILLCFLIYIACKCAVSAVVSCAVVVARGLHAAMEVSGIQKAFYIKTIWLSCRSAMWSRIRAKNCLVVVLSMLKSCCSFNLIHSKVLQFLGFLCSLPTFTRV